MRYYQSLVAEYYNALDLSVFVKEKVIIKYNSNKSSYTDVFNGILVYLGKTSISIKKNKFI